MARRNVTPMTSQEIADRIEIDDLITRYATAVDTKDWDLYRTVFTDDAVIDYTSAGGIRGSLGEVVEWLLLVWTASQAEEWRDQIVYVPVR